MEESSQLQLLQESINRALDIIQRARSSRTNRPMLRSTLEDQSPLVEEIKQYNDGLERPIQDLQKLFAEIEEEEEGIVRKSAKICFCNSRSLSAVCFCNSRSLSACCDNLQRKDSVVRYTNVNMNSQMARDLKETLTKMRDILAVISKDNSKQKRDISGPEIMDMCGAEAEIGLDVLEDKPIIKECFMDLVLFPKAQGISVAALIDMWAELYQLNDDGKDAMTLINEFTTKKLAKLIVTRYNNRFVYFFYFKTFDAN